MKTEMPRSVSRFSAQSSADTSESLRQCGPT
jgi:hypothetical protein